LICPLIRWWYFLNEEQIVVELKKGNYIIFSEIVDLYKRRVFSMTYKFTNNYDEAQDLAQDIFLKIYKELGGFRFESKLSTWIYRVSINMCLDWKRKNSRVKVINLTGMSKGNDEEPTIDIIDDSPLPEEKLIVLEDKQLVHKVIYQLPDIYKAVIIMYHFNNMSYSEIAQTLDIPEKTVETRLYRGRRILKEKLADFRFGGEDKWTVKKS